MSTDTSTQYRRNRQSTLIWVFGGTCVGVGMGALIGCALGLWMLFGSPGRDTLALVPALTLYGMFIGSMPGLASGVLMTAVDRLLDRPRGSALTAVIVGLSVSALLSLW